MKLRSTAARVVMAAVVSFSGDAGADELPPGTFRIPGTTTTLTLSGHARLDVTYDFKSRDPLVTGEDFGTLTSRLPLNSSFEGRKNGQLYMTARTSRLGIATMTDAGWADIGSRIEGDFWSGNLLSSQTFTNSVLFRLRHAYGTLSGRYGTLLVGQTWTTFLDLVAFPDVVDWIGPGSTAAIRQPMIRYVIPLPARSSFALALENAPGTDQNGITDGPGTKQPFTRKVQRIPDLIGRFSMAGDWGTASVGAVATQYRDAGAPGADSYSKYGWGVSAAAAVKIFNDTFRTTVAGGRGIGRYIVAAGTTGQAATNTGDSFVLWNALGYHVNYTHVWSPQLRSNAVWSQTLMANNGASTADAPYEATVDPATGELIDPFVNQRIEELFVNTFFTLTKQVEFGLEYAFSQRHTFGNDAAPSQVGTMHRITTTALFSLF
ncbi:DcaP family trimeric outer membrane transporter [Pendulispora rubella]|uniref:DcaP family trimeric outer membrane transporter n=1 Tax=Pendulispora rubella TaxID=2741070 RepID=A0ABZ2LDS5_9BACT